MITGTFLPPFLTKDPNSVAKGNVGFLTEWRSYTTGEPSITNSAMGFAHTVCSYRHFMLLWSAILIRYVVTCAGNKSSYSTPVLLVHQIPTEMVCMEDHDNHPSGDSIVRPYGLRRRQFSDQISVLGNQNHGWNGLFTRNPTLSFIMLSYCRSRTENWIRNQSVCQNSGCGLQYATFAQHWLTWHTHTQRWLSERDSWNSHSQQG